MDILLFFIGIVFLQKRKYDYVLAIIILLASDYLQLALPSAYTEPSFPIKHRISDTGILLYLLFYIRFIRKGLNFKHPLSKVILIFYLFLLLNGLWDWYNGVATGDIIRYLRRWIFLSILWIVPYISHKDIWNAIKCIYYITLLMCMALIVQRVTGLEIIEARSQWLYQSGNTIIDRGIKPPVFVIICSVFTIANIYNFTLKKKLLHLSLFLGPVILTLKMTYAVTILGTLVLYFWLVPTFNFKHFLKYFIIVALTIGAFLVSNPIFYNRFTEITSEAKVLKGEEASGTFSFRLLHFYERFEYMSQDFEKMLRGLGYVQEKNFKKTLFHTGLFNEEGEVIQLDTGDIAWSVFIIRLGIAGIILYLIWYLKLVSFLYKHRYGNKLVSAYCAYLIVALVFQSLGNAVICDSYYYIIPFLLTKFANRDTYENYPLYIQSKYRRSRNYAH